MNNEKQEDLTLNNRNINAAGKPETIYTALEKLRKASERYIRTHHARRHDEAFQSHIKTFASTNICYAAVNGISVPVSLG